MARGVSITRGMIVAAGVDFVTEHGLARLNARSLADHLGCSIQPIFKNFRHMEGCKSAIVEALEGDYHAFIDARVDPEDELFTVSLAHVQLAMEQKHLFELIFQAGLYRVRTVDEVVKSSHNRRTVDSIARQYGVGMEAAEAAYRDVRFYSLGMAQGAYAGTVHFVEGECEALLRNAIERFLG